MVPEVTPHRVLWRDPLFALAYLHRVVEAGALAGVAGGTDRVNADDDGVYVTVGREALNMENVA